MMKFQICLILALFAVGTFGQKDVGQNVIHDNVLAVPAPAESKPVAQLTQDVHPDDVHHEDGALQQQHADYDVQHHHEDEAVVHAQEAAVPEATLPKKPEGEPAPVPAPPTAPEEAPKETTKSEGAADSKTAPEAKKPEKKGAWGWWSKLTCLIMGPLGYGCPGAKKEDKNNKENGANGEKSAVKGRGVRGMIAVIEDSGEEEGQFEEQLESFEKEVAGGDEEQQQQPQEAAADVDQSAAAGNNASGEGEVKGEVKVSASAVESTTDEEGKTHTNVAKLDAQGTVGQ